MSIVTYENVDTPVFEIDYLRYLFTNGAQGALWGPLPYYSDAAGTVEADWGDPVGNIPDASGNGNDWTQVTSTARPILGRVPVGGRRNLWPSTTENLVSSLNYVGVPNALNTSLSSEGFLQDGSEIFRLTAIGSGGVGAAHDQFPVFGSVTDPYAIAVDVYIPTASSVYLSTRRAPGGSRSADITLNPITGEYVLGGASVHDGAALPLGGYRWRLWVSRGPVDSDGGSNYFSVVATGLAEGEYIELYRPQAERNLVATPYQRVGNEYDITEAGVSEIHYLRFDGTDDQVTTTLPAISGGTIVLAGTNGIWIDEIDFAGGAFSVGPGTYTGGPAGLRSILGDILVGGGFVIDRALTHEEVAQVEDYYVARGAGDLIEEMP